MKNNATDSLFLTLTLAVLGGLGHYTGNLVLIAPFGATAFVVFCYPDNAFAKTRNYFFSHLLCSAIGIAFAQFTDGSFLMMALAVGISSFSMRALNVPHPPAAGDPILIMLSHASYDFLLFPILAGVSIIAVMSRLQRILTGLR